MLPQAMKRTTHYLRSTMLVALLQPAPETLELFDDIMVLSSGKASLVPNCRGRQHWEACHPRKLRGIWYWRSDHAACASLARSLRGPYITPT